MENNEVALKSIGTIQYQDFIKPIWNCVIEFEFLWVKEGEKCDSLEVLLFEYLTWVP